MKDKRNLSETTCNSGQTSSFSSERSVINQGERACGSACNKTALCNLYTCASAFTGGKGRFHLHKIADLLQHSSTCVQIATLLLLATTKGNMSRSLHLHYDCLNERPKEKRNYWPDSSVTY